MTLPSERRLGGLTRRCSFFIHRCTPLPLLLRCIYVRMRIGSLTLSLSVHVCTCSNHSSSFSSFLSYPNKAVRCYLIFVLSFFRICKFEDELWRSPRLISSSSSSSPVPKWPEGRTTTTRPDLTGHPSPRCSNRRLIPATLAPRVGFLVFLVFLTVTRLTLLVRTSVRRSSSSPFGVQATDHK